MATTEKKVQVSAPLCYCFDPQLCWLYTFSICPRDSACSMPKHYSFGRFWVESSLLKKVHPCSRPTWPESELSGWWWPPELRCTWTCPLGLAQLPTGASRGFATSFTAWHNGGWPKWKGGRTETHSSFSRPTSLLQSRDLSMFCQLQEFALSLWRKGVYQVVASQNYFAK